jgi:DnaK suppressor protein
MDDDRARELIAAKRAELRSLLDDTQRAGQDDRASEQEQGDAVDPAPGFEAEAVDDAVAEGVRQRLEALDRADQRVAAGSYGRSVRSGDPIPDERLEIDPAAELTVDEAAADEA